MLTNIERKTDMKFYQVSFIDFEDNCTYKLFSNKKDAEKFIKTDGQEFYFCSEEPDLKILKSTRKADILDFVNHISY